MKRLIYLLPLLLIGCKEAPKEYYSAGEVEVIEPVKHTTIVSDSDTIPIDNTSKNTSSNSNEVSPEAIEYMNKMEEFNNVLKESSNIIESYIEEKV